MGCSGSKQVDVVADVYKPPPTSVALFDITKIEEPWLLVENNDKLEEQEDEEEDLKKNQTTPIPLPLLEKLDSSDAAPTSWNEVSKALEDLKPSIESNKTTPFALPSKTKKPLPPPKAQPAPNSNNNNTMPVVVTAAPATTTVGTAPADNPPATPIVTAPTNGTSSRAIKELGSIRSVKENSFIIRDRELKKASNDAVNSAIATWRRRRDPLEGYPEKRPPGKSGEGIVLYTTTLRGVRRTFEDCERARQAIEAYATEAGLVPEERDVSLHAEYLKEMKELAGEEAVVPRLFIRGRYIGGIDEVMELADTGKLKDMLKWVHEGKGGRKDCEGCGGARFVPCFECHGSCKVVSEDGKGIERCEVCNENGLELCPICH
ncbi:Glutaredoxin family protein [Rhynchospora pubera]|uniref:Glutaredoxin family protein n=1 Tax=Rhynchospora pubera TaxID=906938 RepID=A0AAV8DDU4_9POAL|nr:Glutaredoxin family protein [Rhynchospora pubera]